MDYNEIEQSIIQEWKLMNEKDDLTESDLRKIELWITHKEFRDIVISTSDVINLLMAYPQLEMLNRKWPIIWFSEFYTASEGYKDFQKTEYLN